MPISLEITALAHGGEGIGRHEGKVVFVPHGVPGDTVAIRLTEEKKSYARGEVLAVERPSPWRVPAPCPHYPVCGGCQLQEVSYLGQLTMKRDLVAGLLREASVAPVLGMDEPWGYRNKAMFPVALAGGRVVAGPYAARSHRVVPVTDCPVQAPANNRLLAAAVRLWGQRRLSVYDEGTQRGLLRHLLARCSPVTGESLLAFVVSGSIPQGPELAASVLGATTVVENIQPKATNAVLGDQERVLAGPGRIREGLMGLEFAVSARSFFQVNPLQTAILYRLVGEFAALSGGETLLDAYCGTGTIALVLAAGAAARGWRGRAIGIEENPAAVADAVDNARRNGLADRIQFRVGAVEKVLPALGGSIDVAVLDPPRAGCQPEVLKALLRLGPERIVYVSCNPVTLARDLKLLPGYRLTRVQPVDMFPHTAHIETAVLLENVEKWA